jgi:hypothetical protein
MVDIAPFRGLLFKAWLSINLVHKIAALRQIRLVRVTLLGYYNF